MAKNQLTVQYWDYSLNRTHFKAGYFLVNDIVLRCCLCILVVVFPSCVCVCVCVCVCACVCVCLLLFCLLFVFAFLCFYFYLIFKGEWCGGEGKVLFHLFIPHGTEVA